MPAQPTRTIRPNSVPQETFLASDADIAIYGGAAGGGKTFAELVEAMRHTGNPDFGAVIFRRTSPQITNEGGLWDEAGKLYPHVGATPRVGDLEWVFPSGSRVTFRHLQHEATKYHWQGSQIPLIEFDELTHFSESQFWYLASRNRSTCGVRPYIRGACNADAGSWVKRLLAPWVDRKHPMFPTRCGGVLWLIRKGGKYHWHRTRAEAAESHPGVPPKSVTFVRATVHDNVDLLREDPGYLANLHAQDAVERARLLDGDWDVVNDGLVYPEMGTCVVEPEGWPRLPRWDSGGIDWGWHNPFGALAAHLDSDDVLWVGWERHGSKVTLTEHSKAMPRGAIRWWGDPAGADQIAEMRGAGHDVVPCVHLGRDALEDGIAKVTDRIRTGRLKVRGDLGHLLDEAGKYRRDEKGKLVDRDNHLLAALRYMVVGLDRGRAVRDQAPPPTDFEIAARRAKEEAERRAREETHRSIDNEHWWGGDDDG